MRGVFWGFFFILLNVNFNLGNGASIGLLPDCIGFFCMAKGLVELLQESKRFQRVRVLACIAGVYSSIPYVLRLLGMTLLSPLADTLLGLLYQGAKLWMGYQVAGGIADMECRHGADLHSTGLAAPLGVMTAVSLLGGLGAYFSPALALVCWIVSMGSAIAFLVQFRMCMGLYDAAPFSARRP